MQYKALRRILGFEVSSLARPQSTTRITRDSASNAARQDIECLRLFNSFCIVYFHASRHLPVWLKGCLLVFIITTSFLSGAKHRAFRGQSNACEPGASWFHGPFGSCCTGCSI